MNRRLERLKPRMSSVGGQEGTRYDCVQVLMNTNVSIIVIPGVFLSTQSRFRIIKLLLADLSVAACSQSSHRLCELFYLSVPRHRFASNAVWVGFTWPDSSAQLRVRSLSRIVRVGSETVFKASVDVADLRCDRPKATEEMVGTLDNQNVESERVNSEARPDVRVDNLIP